MLRAHCPSALASNFKHFYSCTFLLLFLFGGPLVPRVQAHGYIQTVVVDGQAFPGWNPFSDPYLSPVPQRVVRKIPNDGPITNIQDPNLACNTGGEQGTGMIADAPAGSTVAFEWTNWPADHLGPVSTYMTSCGKDCSNFDVSGAEWFKIDAEGYDNNQWASARLIANNNTWTSIIPATLAPGQYLMRHEIVALHSVGQPQYYPGCTQVNVFGSGNGHPAPSDTVQIPGLYNSVQFPDIWTATFSSFPAPGPAVAAFIGSTDGSNQGGSSSDSSPSTIAPNSSNLPTSTTPSFATSATPSSAPVSSVSTTPSLTTVHSAGVTAFPGSTSPLPDGQCRLIPRGGNLHRRHALVRRRSH